MSQGCPEHQECPRDWGYASEKDVLVTGDVPRGHPCPGTQGCPSKCIIPVYYPSWLHFLLLQVRGPGLGVVGVSKGAEVALAMATFLPQVVATVWINGTAFLYGNQLVYKDLRIPPIPYYTERIQFTEVGAIDNSAIFADPRDPAYRASAIPVEKIRGKVLFVVGEADRSFNSKLFAELALARMPPDSGRILSYPGAGHLIEPPGSPLCSNSSIRGTPRPVAWGGEPQPHARAQEQSWQEILQFLELHLGSVATMKL